nr:hypothetical protein [Tanacetum cinerariifolium]
MAASGSSNVIARCKVDKLAEFSGETQIPKYMKFFILQKVAKGRRFLNFLRDEAQNARNVIAHLNGMISEFEAMDDQMEAYDSLWCLKESIKGKNNKLLGLNAQIVDAKEDISIKEGHVEIMEAQIVDTQLCLKLIHTDNDVHSFFVDAELNGTPTKERQIVVTNYIRAIVNGKAKMVDNFGPVQENVDMGIKQDVRRRTNVIGLIAPGASVSVMPLSTYLNLGLGELAHSKLTVKLADRTVKYPKGIAKNVLVDYFESWEEKIIFKSAKPASSLIKRDYMLGLRERMELDLEARLMGETLVLNRSLDPFFEDYIELNDLNVPLELKKDQVDDLMPIIEEGEVVKEFRARNDARIVRFFLDILVITTMIRRSVWIVPIT